MKIPGIVDQIEKALKRERRYSIDDSAIDSLTIEDIEAMSDEEFFSLFGGIEDLLNSSEDFLLYAHSEP